MLGEISPRTLFGYLQRSPEGLFAFDGFEEGFEIAFTEAFGAFALDDFEEDGGPVLNRFGKNLEEVPLFIAIDEDIEFFEFFEVFIDGAYPF